MSSTEPGGRHILIVDDDRNITLILSQMLAGDGHQIGTARDGREALASVAANPPDLILLDLDMPSVPGFEVCRQLKQDPATRLIPILIITGQLSSESKLRAWDLGADEFLTKPFQRVEVLSRCRSLLRIKHLVDELDSAQAVVFAFARTVEAKCSYTQGHAERVTHYAMALADQIGLSDADREVLRHGAILHDIGKISIPDAILNKPGALTTAEYAIVKQHPLQGVRIVEPLRSVRHTIPLIRWHHERLDGGGYPDGLWGGAIPLLARILSVVDVYDALASERPYRPRVPQTECLAMLRANAAGGGLDPELVECLSAALAGLAPRHGARSV
jgi:putative two-component system response regulator